MIFSNRYVVQQLGQSFHRQSYQPVIWLKYINNHFFIWTHGEGQLEKFMADFNAFNPNIQFNNSIAFLDRHQYLHYSSSHPEHTKRSIVFSQTLRVSRICSREKDFRDHCLQMRS